MILLALWGLLMTLVAVWSETPDEHVYVATDSRLSDVSGSGAYWDRASKIFQVAGFPEVVAYCGKTEPLLVAISQTAQCLRYADVLGNAGSNQTPQLLARVSAACIHLDEAIANYPKGWMGEGGSMFFAGYDHRLKYPRVFRVKVTSKGVVGKAGTKQFKHEEISFRDGPRFFGSGDTTAKTYLARGKTAFDCLKSAILGKRVKSVGGVPQVVRIDVDGVKPVGVVWDGEPYLFGMQLQYHSKMARVEWRDKSFQTCSYPKAAKVTRIVAGKRRQRKKK